MEEVKYEYMGMIFNKIFLDDHIVLVPYNIARCNIEDELTYDVEGIGILSSCFEIGFDEEISLGFIEKIDEIRKKGNNLEESLRIYRKEITDYVYIQTLEAEKDIKYTYRLDLYNNTIEKCVIFKDGKLKFLNEPIKNNKIKNIISNYTPTIVDLTEEETENNISNDTKIDIDIHTLYKKLKESIIGQDEALKHIAVTIDRNYKINNYRNKTNILIIGPSGSGKTEIFRTVENILNMPVIIEDSEQYSAVGYQGASISDMLTKLYFKADCDLNKAEHGILVIDEIDKKISDSKDDVSGSRILSSLLALMEGTDFRINISNNEMDPEYINFNTNNLTVVLAGAFTDIFKTSKHIGIGRDIENKTKDYSIIDKKKLNEYGLSDENLRRVSIINLNRLSIENLIEIMNNSKNSVLKEYKDYTKKYGIDLKITDEALYEIAKKAYNKETGASGLKDTLNELLDFAYFEISENPSQYKSIDITKDSLNNNPPYILTKKSR